MAKSSRQMRISRSPYDAGYVSGSDKPILSVRGCVYHMVSGVLLWVYPIETKKEHPERRIVMAEAKVKRTKAELREAVEALCKQYNENIQEGNFQESTKLNDEIEQTVNEYTSIAREECFDALKATENPMLEAVKQLTFPTIRAKDTKQGDEKIPVRVIEDIEKPIDLLKLHKAVDGGIGADKNWAYKVEKLNFLLTAQKAKDLGIDPKEVNDSFAMADISKQIDMGKNPTSKTNLLKTVNAVVQAMIGEEYKAVSHDVNFLMSVFSRKNRAALTVSCANHKYLRQYMAEICHRIVMGETYKIEFRKVRK